MVEKVLTVSIEDVERFKAGIRGIMGQFINNELGGKHGFAVNGLTNLLIDLTDSLVAGKIKDRIVIQNPIPTKKEKSEDGT